MLKRAKEVVFEYPQPPAPYQPSQRSGALIGPSGVGKRPLQYRCWWCHIKLRFTGICIFTIVCSRCRSSVGRMAQACSNCDESTRWRKLCGNTWEPDTLEKIIERHKRVNAHLKATHIKKDMWSSCLSMISPTRVTSGCTHQQILWRVYLFGVATLVVHVGYWHKY